MASPSHTRLGLSKVADVKTVVLKKQTLPLKLATELTLNVFVVAREHLTTAKQEKYNIDPPGSNLAQ